MTAATLVKTFNPAESRDPGGKWTSGGGGGDADRPASNAPNTKPAKTPQQVGADAQRAVISSQTPISFPPKLGVNAVAAARKKYGIPKSLAGMSKQRKAAARQVLSAAAKMAYLDHQAAYLAGRQRTLQAQLERQGMTQAAKRWLQARLMKVNAAMSAVTSGRGQARTHLAASLSVFRGRKVKPPKAVKKSPIAALIKVGPKGYEHGWRYVGAPGVGRAVHHPEHGRGTLTRHGKTVGVQFDSGHYAAYDRGEQTPDPGEHFTPSGPPAKPAKKKTPAKKAAPKPAPEPARDPMRVGERTGAAQHVRDMLGADAPTMPPYATGRTQTGGGSSVWTRLRPRRPRPDDRVYDPDNPRRLGTVHLVPGDGTIHVRWDDGQRDVRPEFTVVDQLAELRRHYAATPPAPPRRMDEAMDRPAKRKLTSREQLEEMVAAGVLTRQQRQRVFDLARGKKPSLVLSPGQAAEASQRLRDRGEMVTLDSLSHELGGQYGKADVLDALLALIAGRVNEAGGLDKAINVAGVAAKATMLDWWLW